MSGTVADRVLADDVRSVTVTSVAMPVNPFAEVDADDRLAIHLADHRALIEGELALADRCRSAHEGTELGHLLTRHIGESSVDGDLVDELSDRLGHRPSRLKSFGAVVAERFGRLKLNGQVFGSSPLAAVVELEGLVAASHARSVLWETLGELGVLERFDLGPVGTQRAVLAHDRIDVLRRHLSTALGDAVTDDRSGTS